MNNKLKNAEKLESKTVEMNAGEEYLLRNLAEAASDYTMGKNVPDFAEKCGGITKLQDRFFKAVNDYEAFLIDITSEEL